MVSTEYPLKLNHPSLARYHLPRGLRERLHDARLTPITEGMSGTDVFRIHFPNDSTAYLKIARRGSAQDLQPELSRLLWLQHRLPVPDVLYFAESGELQHLLISAVPGLVLYHDELRPHLPEMIRQYAQILRQIHALSLDECPFDARVDVKIAQARRLIDAGEVHEDDFDEERTGWSAERVYRQVMATRPTDEDLVWTHGDYCTPNVLVDPVTLTATGIIDWGRAGIADRYQDLALAARSIEYNFGTDWVAPFFAAYGLTTPDEAKLTFYRLLDELF